MLVDIADQQHTTTELHVHRHHFQPSSRNPGSRNPGSRNPGSRNLAVVQLSIKKLLTIAAGRAHQEQNMRWIIVICLFLFMCCDPKPPAAPPHPSKTNLPATPSATPTAANPSGSAAITSTSAATSTASAGLAPSVRCGPNRCSGTTPDCCEHHAQRGNLVASSFECIARSANCPMLRRQCDDPGDCGAERSCCWRSPGTYCSASCRLSAGEKILCSTIADCPVNGKAAPSACGDDGMCRW